MDLHQPLSILLVEDDDMASEVLCSMLAIKFPESILYSAGNGKAGLECFKKCLPDIVITDINMPEMDGISMFSVIHAIHPRTKIIVVTSHSDRQSLARITSTGVELDLVSKPIDFETLFNVIDRRIASLSA